MLLTETVSISWPINVMLSLSPVILSPFATPLANGPERTAVILRCAQDDRPRDQGDKLQVSTASVDIDPQAAFSCAFLKMFTALS